MRKTATNLTKRNASLSVSKTVRFKILKILTWFVSQFADNSLYHKETLAMVQTIARWIDTRGPVWTADRIKLTRLHVLRYLAGQPLSINSPLSLSKDSLPKLIPVYLRQCIRDGDVEGIRLILTVLSITRIIMGGKPTDFTPITTPSEARLPLGEWKSFLGEWVTKYKLEGLSTDFPMFHYSTKSGPNGPSLTSSIEDALILPDSLLEAIGTLGGNYLSKIVNSLRSMDEALLTSLIKWSSKYYRRKTNILRKLSIRKDREAKTRIFAILDYWSQSALYGLHRSLYQALKKFPQDATFNQDIVKTVPYLPDTTYYSFDLSNATDRFPLSLQRWVLAAMIGETKAAAWENIMVGLPFHYDGQTYSYRAGQPMGAHSSWALFTLCHHFIIQLSCSQVGIDPFKFRSYLVLGDDVLIWDRRVAAVYKKLMTETLGVDISESKTFTSNDMFEFARRVFYKGQEISPFPVAGLIATAKKYHLLYEVLKLAAGRGYPIDPAASTPRLSGLLEALGVDHWLVNTLLKRIKCLCFIPKGAATWVERLGAARHLGSLLRCNLPCGDLCAVSSCEEAAQLALRRMKTETCQKLEAQFYEWLTSPEFSEIATHLKLGPETWLGEKPTKVEQFVAATTVMAALADLSLLPPANGAVDETEKSLSLFQIVPQMNLWARKLSEHKWLHRPYNEEDAELPLYKGEEAFHTIWDDIDAWEVLLLPKSGVNPMRRRDRLVGGNAQFISNLAGAWKSSNQVRERLLQIDLRTVASK